MSLNQFFQYFVPKERKIFFPLFEQAASNVVEMSNVLITTFDTLDLEKRNDLIKLIDKLENKGDDLTHQIYLELGKNFITPFDREDIHSLATAIDDVADFIQGTANRLSLYNVTEVSSYMKELAELILQSSRELEKAVQQLKDLRNIRLIADCCIRINSLENQADSVFNHAVAELFLSERDAINVIKYKEILTVLETATDKCEDAANVIESILVKIHNGYFYISPYYYPGSHF